MTHGTGHHKRTFNRSFYVKYIEQRDATRTRNVVILFLLGLIFVMTSMEAFADPAVDYYGNPVVDYYAEPVALDPYGSMNTYDTYGGPTGSVYDEYGKPAGQLYDDYGKPLN